MRPVSDYAIMLMLLDADGTDDVPDELADILASLRRKGMIVYRHGLWKLTQVGQSYLEDLAGQTLH